MEAEIHFYVNADEDSSGALHSDSGVGAFWSLFVQAVVIDGEPDEPEIGGIGTVIARNAAQRQGTEEWEGYFAFGVFESIFSCSYIF